MTVLRMLSFTLYATLLSACVSAPTLEPARLPPGEWALDPAHASALWRIQHMGLSWYTGRFDAIDARLSFDAARPENARLTAIIDAASISTGDPAFDQTLCSASWFDCDAHPQIVFRSDHIEVTGPDTGLVHGQLTLKGVTQPAVLETQFYGGVFNPLEARQALGFGADMTINRTDFRVGRLPGNLIGDTVVIRIEAEFLRDRGE
ncbi:YceI family protein [Oceanicaulis sp.]|uniref:YceI family protein n=1 Tax=Oceanicaulis sp. TaxID=1924941 RepID=UPI003BAA0709